MTSRMRAQRRPTLASNLLVAVDESRYHHGRSCSGLSVAAREQKRRPVLVRIELFGAVDYRQQTVEVLGRKKIKRDHSPGQAKDFFLRQWSRATPRKYAFLSCGHLDL